MPEWRGTLFGIFLDSSLRVSLVAAIVALILIIMRVRSSSVRHAAWTAVLCAMLLMPVLPYCVPSFMIPLRFAVPGSATTPSANTEVVLPSMETSALPADLGNRGTPTPVVASAIAPMPAAGTLPAHASIWPTAVLIVYIAGLVALLSRLFLGWRVMRRILRTSQEIDPNQGSLVQLAASCGASKVCICESRLVAAPLTAGVAFPRIILPPSWTLWADGKIRAVLAHELAHVERRDQMVSFLARLNRCIFWFHPLAWWLERKLASMAEHACDDAAVRVVGETRRYAEILLDMAEAVRRSGSRFSWQGVGVSGSGLLGQRIDRILRGDFFREVSRTRKAIVAVGCAAAIFVAVACHRQAAPPAPLREDPQYAEQQAKQKAQSDFYKTAHDMNPQQVADLEASLKKNPEDLVTLEKLLMFYAPISEEVKGEKGKWAPICAQVIGERECIAARRPHILWLIEHHPDNKLAGDFGARIFPTTLGPLADPAAYATAKKLWLEKTSPSDVSVAVLKNAAAFFEASDKPLAEKMLLRAQALDPKGHYSYSLGRLYALVLVGSNSSMPLNVVRTVSAAEAHRAYAQEIRKKLAETTDAELLTTAAEYLDPWARRLYEGHKIDFDPVALSKSYLERATQLNPQLLQAQTRLRYQRTVERGARLRAILQNVAKDAQYQTIAALPDAERFGFLPGLAISAYAEGENADYYNHDTTGAKAAWALARKYAQDELQLASKLHDDPEYGTNIYMGNIVLGLVTFREGNKQAAVKYMLAASHAPAAEDLDYYLNFHTRLTGYLLKYGERESVIEFLERIAPLSTMSKTAWLDDANKIRKGIQPVWYPRDDTSQAPGR